MVGTYVKAEQEKAGNKRAIEPADLVTSQLNPAMEAAAVQHCAVVNLEMRPQRVIVLRSDRSLHRRRNGPHQIGQQQPQRETHGLTPRPLGCSPIGHPCGLAIGVLLTSTGV